jgi:ABC-type Zn2+ transport system substrate-binding protein/surface adhesin
VVAAMTFNINVGVLNPSVTCENASSVDYALRFSGSRTVRQAGRSGKWSRDHIRLIAFVPAPLRILIETRTRDTLDLLNS